MEATACAPLRLLIEQCNVPKMQCSKERCSLRPKLAIAHLRRHTRKQGRSFSGFRRGPRTAPQSKPHRLQSIAWQARRTMFCTHWAASICRPGSETCISRADMLLVARAWSVALANERGGRRGPREMQHAAHLPAPGGRQKPHNAALAARRKGTPGFEPGTC